MVGKPKQRAPAAAAEIQDVAEGGQIPADLRRRGFNVLRTLLADLQEAVQFKEAVHTMPQPGGRQAGEPRLFDPGPVLPVHLPAGHSPRDSVIEGGKDRMGLLGDEGLDPIPKRLQIHEMILYRLGAGEGAAQLESADRTSPPNSVKARLGCQAGLGDRRNSPPPLS